MGLPRDLVKLESELFFKEVDTFLPFEFKNSPAIQQFLPTIIEAGFTDPTKVLKLCLQSLRIQSLEHDSKTTSAEFVATLPQNVPGSVRPTNIVMMEIIKSAKKELIVLGYEFNDLNLISQIHEAQRRGVETFIILDRERGAVKRILSDWPAEVPLPKIYQDRKRSDSSTYASMHAKCLLADQHDLLITSANFTFHGLHGNIEIGVRLSGHSAQESRKLFSFLVESNIVTEIDLSNYITDEDKSLG